MYYLMNQGLGNGFSMEKGMVVPDFLNGLGSSAHVFIIVLSTTSWPGWWGKIAKNTEGPWKVNTGI